MIRYSLECFTKFPLIHVSFSPRGEGTLEVSVADSLSPWGEGWGEGVFC